MSKSKPEFRSGYVALVGRPNVGKSTLLNHLLGQKISITSRKPQTTRHQILGIKTTDTAQIIYVDTPGIHRHGQRAMNRYMNRAATSALVGVQVALFLIEALHWTEEDELVLERLRQSGVPVILVVNKVDKLKDKAQLLPFLQELAGKYEFEHIVPVSALKGKGLDELETLLCEYLQESPPHFPADQITDRSIRFLAAEIIREKLMRQLGQEVPYDLTVEIERFKEKDRVIHIHALIWVERANQKAIVIGKKGERLKAVGEQARKDIEALVDKKVFLELWVKVKEGWSDDERALQSLGYRDEFDEG
jgi:GTP-binding protein Era